MYHESIVDLGLAMVRRRGVMARCRREGYTQHVAEADRDSLCEMGQALGAVYVAFGYDEQVFSDARRVANQIWSAAREAS